MLAVVHARHDDVAALDVAHVLFRRRAVDRIAHALDPRPGDVDEHFRGHLGRRLRSHAERRSPVGAAGIALPPRGDEPRPDADVGAAQARVHHVEHGEPRVVDTRIGIDEPLAERGLEPRAPRRSRQVDTERGRQRLAPAEMVVQEEARAQHPRRTQVGLVRQDERQRRHDVRRLVQHDFALGERLADQAELVLLEIAQSAVNELRAPLRSGRRDVALLDQEHLEAATGGVARDARAVDAGADDEEIELRGGRGHESFLVRVRSFFVRVLPRF